MVLTTQNSNTQHVGVGMTNVEKREPTDSDGDDNSEEGYSDFLALLNEGPSTESNKQSSSLPPVVVEVEATVVPTKESTDDDSDWLNGPTKNNEETARSTTSTEASSVTKTTPPVKTIPEAVLPVAAAPPAVESTTSITSEESTSQAPAPKKKASAQAAPTKPAPADDASAAISVADSIAASVIGSLHIRDDAPVAVEYFTKKAAVADAMATISKRQLAVDNMSDAHRYFDKKTTEDAIKHAAEVKELIEAPRPAAVEYFTLKDMEARAERKAANEEAVQNAQAPLAVEFFTNKARTEAEAKAAEIAALKENPPPPSAAGRHFAEVERRKRLETEAMAKEPAPAAIEYFTRKAEEERRMQEEARRRSEDDGGAAVASVATQHFERQKSVRAAEIEASRARAANDKTPDEVLPVDYFQKLGEAELAAKAKAQFDIASKEMPIGIRYFTAKGQEDKARALAKQQSLSNQTMSAATRHFQKIDDEREATSLQDQPKKEAMPAAIQKFTLAEYAARDKKKAEIREMHDNPPEMAAGTAYFTKMMNDRAAEKKAEIERLKANPPPASAAGQHFEKLESQRKLEMEALRKEPAPAAIEYFTNKAKEEKRAQEEATKRTGDAPVVASVATQHFEKQKSMRLQQMQSKRAVVQNRPSEEALPIDYFAKLGEAETAARAQSRRDLAESHMPDAVRYFTNMAEEKKAAKLAEFEKGGGDGQNMSVATAYFNKLAAEEKAEKARKAEETPERMPMAIQKFTLAAEEERQKKKAALEQMKVNPPPVPVGVSHFTPDADQS